MTAPLSGCARDDCCQRQRGADEDDLEAVAGRVVREMLERHIEVPRPGGDFLARAANVGVAINSALRAAMVRRRSAGAAYETWPDDGSFRVPFLVLNHPDAVRDYEWVDRYRVVREPLRTTVLDFVVVGGLCVVSSSRGTWIVHSPAVRSVAQP